MDGFTGTSLLEPLLIIDSQRLYNRRLSSTSKLQASSVWVKDYHYPQLSENELTELIDFNKGYTAPVEVKKLLALPDSFGATDFRVADEFDLYTMNDQLHDLSPIITTSIPEWQSNLQPNPHDKETPCKNNFEAGNPVESMSTDTESEAKCDVADNFLSKLSTSNSRTSSRENLDKISPHVPLTICPAAPKLSNTKYHLSDNLTLTKNAFTLGHRNTGPTSVTDKLIWNIDDRNTLLKSPCFFHHRFDEVVNIEKVVKDIQNDDNLSHSQLMLTASTVREMGRQLQRTPVRNAVKNIMIVTKARDNSVVHLTRELTEWLTCTPRYKSQYGVTVWVDSKLKESKRFNAGSLHQKLEACNTAGKLKFWTRDLCASNPELFDLVLTLGGDGTVLYTSWLFQRVVPPVLPFSLGSLGFLTNFDFSEYQNHLDRVMGESGMRINMRMRFTCTVYRTMENLEKMSTTSTSLHYPEYNVPKTLSIQDNHHNHTLPHPRTRSTDEWSIYSNDENDGVVRIEQFEVLNELVIDRGPSPYVSNLEVYGDGKPLTVIQADGCVFSTPTGSTAYSLSAGGSLVHPDIPAILLTPICPHTLSFRPMLLNDSMLLRVAIPKRSRAGAYCSFDGKNRVELLGGDYVTISASKYPFPTVQSSGQEWFNSLESALRWNTRGATQKPWSNSEPHHRDELNGNVNPKFEDTIFDIDFD